MANTRGQIIERKYGFLVRVYTGLDPQTGKRSYENQKVTGNKTEAKKVLTSMLRKLDTGEMLLEPTKMSVKEYLEHWLITAAKPRLAKTTYDDYAYLLARYAYKHLGRVRLSKLEPQRIQALYSSMLSQDLSPRTVRYTHTVLSNALKQAVKWRMIADNPAKYVDLPKRQRQEMNAMTQDEVDCFLEAAKLNRHYVLFAVMLGTGLRPGEAIALKWADLDPMKATLYIQRSYSPSTGMKTTKNAKSRRRIKLPEHLVKLLLEHKDALLFKSELIFPNLDNKPLYDRNIVLRHYNPCLQAAGLGEMVQVEEEDGTIVEKFVPSFRFYDLRHTHATLLLKAGVHPKIVSERLGHSSITLTLDTYSHVLPGMQDEAADMLNDMLFKGGEEDEDEGEERALN